MPTVTVSQSFAVAVEHHQAGRLAEAETIYRQILNLNCQPESVEALHFLGVIAQQRGDHATAIQQIRQALRLAPNNAGAWSNLGEALRCSGQLDEAAACLRRALELNPTYAEAHGNLGIVLAEQGRMDEAVACYRRALEIKPDSPRVYNDLGIAFGKQGRTDEALTAFRRAVDLQPGDADAWNNLGFALVQCRELEQAIAAYREAIRRAPALVEVYLNLGAALIDRGELQEAIAAFQRALELRPDHAEARNNLGIARQRTGYPDEAIAEYLRALALQPDYTDARCSLASVYKDAGRFNEALEELRCALDKAPDHQLAHSNLIYTLYLHPDYDQHAIAEAKARWNLKFGSPATQSNPPFELEPDPERRLRIGYVSPDLRDHVHGLNLRPLFRWHDHRRYEIVCYSGVEKEDAFTEEFRGWADGWRSVAGLGDEALANMIRQDRIDILVDLTQHLAGNRLLVFARQPAPLQVSFLGYPDGTGLEAIRYRISDSYFESAISDRRSQTELPPGEQSFLLESFLCYEPSGADLEVNPLPALDNGWITFGCLNGFCKLNEPMLAVWAEVLRNVSNSRLLVLSILGQHQERTMAFFESRGVKRERIQFAFPCPRRDYFALYHRVDLALDPFPYNGITTSLDALWMGVPVVSRVGPSPFSRGGLSQLSNVGLPELLAFSDEDFVAIASRLAHDLPRLGELRRTLRARMQSSPLMDAPRYARDIDAAYRSMWRAWCKAATRAAK